MESMPFFCEMHMEVITLTFDNTGHVYDPLEPTKQTEELAYILKNALNGKSITVPVNTSAELTAKDTLIQAFVALMTDGQDDEETGYFSPPMEGLISQINSSLVAFPSLDAISFALSSVSERLDAMTYRRDVEGEVVSVRMEDLQACIQDVAAASGLVLDAYGDIIALQRVVPEGL